MLVEAAIAVADVAAAVLVVAGVAKLREPGAFTSFVRTLGVRIGPMHARAVGTVEIVVGAGALLGGGRPWFGGLALVSTGLVVVSVVSLVRRAPSCGCFGAASAPTGPTHVALNVAFAAGALVGAVDGATPLADRIAPFGEGLPYALFVAVGAGLVVAAMTSAAELVSLRRRPSSAGASDRRPELARR